jgi:hypothetical protein
LPLGNLIVISLSSVPSICVGFSPLMKSIVFAMRSFSSGMLASVFAKVGSSAPATRPQALAGNYSRLCGVVTRV